MVMGSPRPRWMRVGFAMTDDRHKSGRPPSHEPLIPHRGESRTTVEELARPGSPPPITCRHIDAFWYTNKQQVNKQTTGGVAYGVHEPAYPPPPF